MENYPVKIAILGGTLGFSILIISFKIIKNRITKKDMMYKVEVFFRNKNASVQVILDTGNFLVDPITETPVIIIEAQKLKNILPETLLKNIEKGAWDTVLEDKNEDFKTKCSFLPFSSLGTQKGMLMGFRPDDIQVTTPDGETIKSRAMIGIYPHSLTKNGIYNGLIGLNALSGKEGKNEYYSIAKNEISFGK